MWEPRVEVGHLLMDIRDWFCKVRASPCVESPFSTAQILTMRSTRRDPCRGPLRWLVKLGKYQKMKKLSIVYSRKLQ